METEKLIYSIAEAAGLLGVSKNHAYEMCRQRKLPFIQLGKRILVPKKALHQFLEGDHDEKF